MSRPLESAGSTLVVDGYGVSLNTRHGALVVVDGLGSQRRQRLLSRAERVVRRIVILADAGTFSLDAIRWCSDTGIAVSQVDREGRLLLVAGAPGLDDARLRRAQAAAAGSSLGLTIARGLLHAKLSGQASVLASTVDAPSAAELVDGWRRRLHGAPTVVELRDAEAQASNVYFGAWAGRVRCRFAERDRDKVPAHWSDPFSVRRSPIAGGKAPRSAATPVNALLNYGYTLAEVECRLALLTVGLDPGLGVVHSDKRDRDSLALDLLEPLRPVVEQRVLELLAVRYFRADDFHETRQGVCRVLEPVTHALADLMPIFAAAAGPLAEGLAHAFAESSPGDIPLTTPLSQSRRRTARAARRPALAVAVPAVGPTPMGSCRGCGTPLYAKHRQFCTSCWPVHRNALFATSAQAARGNRQAAGTNPSQTPEARQRRHRTLVATKAAEASWVANGGTAEISDQQLHQEVIPSLARVTLRQIEEATGLSNASASRIRRGLMTPHPRHWSRLAALGVSSPS